MIASTLPDVCCSESLGMSLVEEVLAKFENALPEEAMTFSIMDLARTKGDLVSAHALEMQHKKMMFWSLRVERKLQEVPGGCLSWLSSQENGMHNSIVKRAISRGRFSGIERTMPKAPCEVRKSNIHGVGVFATEDIPAFTYLTMYPRDGVKWGPDGLKSGHVGWGWVGNTKLEGERYAMGLQEPKGAQFLTIIGDPSKHDNPHFLGHLINDGATCKSMKAVPIYEHISQAKSNATFCPVSEAIYSTCPIPRGKEILFTYGAQYWMVLQALEAEDVAIPENRQSSNVVA